MRHNRFAWQFNLQYLDEKEAKRHQFMNSQWSPEHNKVRELEERGEREHSENQRHQRTMERDGNQ